MRLPRSLAALVPVALLALAAPGAARDRQEVPEAVADGKPVSCIWLSQVRASHVRSDQVIDFEMAGGKVYRNTLPTPCPSLGFEKRFIHRTSINQLCSTDTITVLQTPPSIPGPTCGLGKFQPIKLVKQKR